MTKVVTTRLDTKIATRMEKAADTLHMDKTSFMRIIIIKGLERVEEDDALARYTKGKISLGKLAEELGLSKWDAHALLEEKAIPLPYDEKDLKDDLDALTTV